MRFIRHVDTYKTNKHSRIYDLSGRNCGKASDIKRLPNGVYVVDGKKIGVK